MISVCLACYNGEKYIREQIESILSEIGEGDELIISDDGSTDKTLEVVESFNESRIKIYKNKFGSHIRNFEFTLKVAQGDYIFLSDQDDVWVPGKVEIMLDALRTADLVLSDCMLIDGRGEVIKESLFDFEKPKTGFLRTFYKNIYTGCCMAFRKNIAEASLPFPEKINSHDMWIGMIAELRGKVKVLPKQLIKFRRHGKNFSASIADDTFLSGRSPYKVSEIINSRVYMLRHLLSKFL